MNAAEAKAAILKLKPEAFAAQGTITERWKIFASEARQQQGISLGSLGGGHHSEDEAWIDAAHEIEILEGIKAHAYKHYDGNRGWDVVIECMDDSDILEIVLPAASVAAAVTKMARYLGPRAEQQRMHDAEAEAGR